MALIGNWNTFYINSHTSKLEYLGMNKLPSDIIKYIKEKVREYMTGSATESDRRMAHKDQSHSL